LKYVKWNGTTSSWDEETVDFGVGGVEIGTSLALDSSDTPHISYFDFAKSDLKYAKWNGATWDIETVDPLGDVGWYSSIALDSSDTPHISYYDITDKNLLYATKMGSTWFSFVVDSAGDVGSYSSIAVDKSIDKVRISYLDATNYWLKYAGGDPSYWDIRVVDPSGDIGMWTSIAVDSQGYQHISYIKYIQPSEYANLKYAKWTGYTWDIQFVDTTANVGYFNSIAVDSNDIPHISYFDLTDYDLKFAEKTGTTTWFREKVDLEYVGWHTSIALDSDDYAHISYYAATHYNDLRYATEAPPNNPPDAPTILANYKGKVGVPHGFSFFANDPDGDDICFFIDWNDTITSGWTALTPPPAHYGEYHTWYTMGMKTVTAWTKDRHGLESYPSTYTVEMPRNRAVSNLLLNYLQNHQNMFPLIQKLLQRLVL